MGSAAVAAVARDKRPQRGRRTGYCAQQAQQTYQNGGGLKGKRLYEWYARLEALAVNRGRPQPVAPHIAEFRRILAKSDRRLQKRKPAI